MIIKPIPIFKGAVENGKLIFWNEEAYQKYLNTIKGNVIVTVEKQNRRRTLPQNALYWLWLSFLEDETGQPKEDFHAYFKKKHLIKIIKLKGKKEITEKVVGSTAELNSFEFTNYLEKVRQEAITDFGINLPSPEDVYI